MANVFSGMIHAVYPLEEFTTQSGNVLKRRKVVIHTVEQYPQSMVVTLRDDLAVEFKLTAGTQVRAYLNFRTFSGKDSDVLFNEIQCWKMETEGQDFRPHGYEL